MSNFNLESDEVVLYEGSITSTIAKGNLQLTLTSLNLIFEKEKGVFKKEKELIDIIPLNSIKFYNEEPQIKQKGGEITIQTTNCNFTIIFSGMIEARKFAGKLIDAVTGTSLTKRGSNKVKSAFEIIDDTLGLDTRGTIKGVLENGVKGTILNGIGKKNKTE